MLKSSKVRAIENHRLLIEKCLTAFLQGAASLVTLDEVKEFIFEAEATEFHAYVATMRAELSCYEIYDTDGSLLEIIQDAWNYFLHRFLDGHCPAESVM